MLHFFDVEGLLVRRWVPGQRRVALEAWTGERWTTYPEVDTLSRHGQRLTYEQAMGLLQSTRQRTGTLTRFSDEQAATALSSRQRRA
ncbi:MAG: hypothetical protein ACRD2I_22940 [Vicinamibacterales bacterium]